MTLTEHLERARALARRKGHARVTSVHLMLSLSNVTDVQRQMAESGYSLARLDRLMRDALAAEPDARGYRDAPEPAIDLALEPVLATRVTELALFQALIAPLAAELAFDEARLRRFYDETARATAASRHRRALVEHALYALARRATDGGRFAETLARLGYPRREFRHRVAQRIAVLSHSAPVGTYAELRARAIAHANATMREALTTEAIVVDLLRAPSTRRALEAIGVSYAPLLFSYVHGGLEPPIPFFAGPAEVVLYTDDFTPVELLAAMLTKYFGQPAAAAMVTAQVVRAEGQAAVRVPDGRPAGDAIAVARAELAALGMPLRIELRAARA